MRAALLLVLLLSACTYVRPRLGEDRDGRPFPPEVVGVPRDTITTTSWPGDPAPAGATYQRRVCRTQTVPRGWAIRAYESDERNCVATTKSRSYNVAVIEDIRRYPVGAVIAICADQQVPWDWSLEPEHGAVQCEGARVRAGEPTALTIRKER